MSDFTELMDLASVRLRGAVLAASDDFFAEKENLLKPGDAVFLPHEYTERGKRMDGWESRRKRGQGFDWAIVRLGVPGVLRGVTVDTAFFPGNYPAECSIEGSALPLDAPLSALLEGEWFEVLPRSALEGDRKNLFAIECPHAFSHVRLNIYPDGGVARLRVYGEAVPEWARLGHARGEIDLAAADHGGAVLECSDMFFGDRRNLIMPDRALNLGDGWQTRRRRGPGFDWAIVRLASAGTITRVLLDTHHFRGNFPDTCRIEALCAAPGMSDNSDSVAHTAADAPWRELLPPTKLQADTRHWFEDALAALGPVTHLRLSVIPDGGVSRLRVFGTLDNEARRALGLRRFNTRTPRAAESALRSCCGSTAWVQAMLSRMPFASATDLLATADACWAETSEPDWLESFRAHPRIGETHAAAGQSATARHWSEGEQSRVQSAGDAVKAELAEVNRAYEARFGFIYIVCASGRTADEMLSLAKERIGHERDDELRIAAAEQHKITRLRLVKLLDP